jgi:hypothetical protein
MLFLTPEHQNPSFYRSIASCARVQACWGSTFCHVRRCPSSKQPNEITTQIIAAVTPAAVLGQQFTIKVFDKGICILENSVLSSVKWQESSLLVNRRVNIL